MTFKKTHLLLASVAALAVLPTAQSSAADALSKTDVEAIIKEYLNENPEVILDALENYRQKQQENLQAQTKQKIQENLERLTSADVPFIGNKDGDVTVIEFFDYNCGYCKRALPDIQELVAEDKDVRVIFREMPILSPESVAASKWALAAHKQGKYFEYHAELMKHRGRKDVESLKEIGKKVGLDVKKLEKDAASEEIQKILDEDQQLAREIGVQGTPAFIINGEFYPGYLGPNGLVDAIEQARGDKKG